MDTLLRFTNSSRTKSLTLGVAFFIIGTILCVVTFHMLLALIYSKYPIYIVTLLALFAFLVCGYIYIAGYRLVKFDVLVSKEYLYNTLRKTYCEHLKELWNGKNIISFVGVDGSGKTTHALLLKSILARLGVKVYLAKIRWWAFTSYIIYFYARLMKRNVVLNRGRRPIKVHAYYIDPVLQRLYPVTLLLDIILYYVIIKLLTKLKRCCILLFDRSFIDVLIDLIWETRQTKFLQNALSRVLIAKSMHHHVTIVFNVEPHIALRRKYQYETLSLKELKFKNRAYEIFRRVLGLPEINTSIYDIPSVFNNLLTSLRLKPFKIISRALKHKKNAVQ